MSDEARPKKKPLSEKPPRDFTSPAVFSWAREGWLSVSDEARSTEKPSEPTEPEKPEEEVFTRSREGWLSL